MLKDTIKAYEEQRINEAQYLAKVNDILSAVLSHTDSDIPEQLRGKDEAKAFFGLAMETLEQKMEDHVLRKEVSTAAALRIDDLIRTAVFDNGKTVIDWSFKSNITGKLLIDIGDYLIDEVRDRYHVDLSFGDMDALAERCIDVAKVRYK